MKRKIQGLALVAVIAISACGAGGGDSSAIQNTLDKISVLVAADELGKPINAYSAIRVETWIDAIRQADLSFQVISLPGNEYGQYQITLGYLSEGSSFKTRIFLDGDHDSIFLGELANESRSD